MKPSRLLRRKTTLWLGLAGGAALLLGAAYLLVRGHWGDLGGRSTPLAIPSARQEEPGPQPSRGELLARRESLLEEQAGAGASAPPLDVRESFDNLQPGALPAGWLRWSNETASTAGASTARSLSAPHGLAFTGITQASVRAWPAAPFPADVQVSGVICLDTLVPAQILARGSALNSATPSYYAASLSRGLEVQLVRVVKGAPTTVGSLKSANYLSGKWVRLTLSASGTNLRVQVFRTDTSQYLSPSGQWQTAAAWALNVTDGQLSQGGNVGLGKGTGYAGTIHLDDFAIQRPEGGAAAGGPPVQAAVAQEAPAGPPVPRPVIPRHYEHIRIAMLAYSGAPFGAFEERLVRESVDLVIPNTGLLGRIHQLSPNTPRLIYTNTSNLYLELLTDWLAYADRNSLSREAAFFHVARSLPFRGDSPSSRPVTWFWGVYRGGAPLTDVTRLSQAGSGRIAFGSAGESVHIGHPDRFREINLRLASGAGGGWSAVLEYASAVDAAGAPTRWTTLPTLSDATARLSQTGLIIFDPPANWKAVSVNGSPRLYFVRFRTTSAGTAPSAITILGRDHVSANGTTSGTIPAFDTRADADGNGYLNDQEYLQRTPGKDARFVHESRMVTSSYGQMRFATNPSSAAFRQWAVDYHVRLLARHPLATGLFMDNTSGKAPTKGEDLLEPVDQLGRNTGVMLAAISQAIAPRWILANTAGAYTWAEPVIQLNPAYFEEFGIRPMSHNWAFFEDLATQVTRRAALTTPAPLAVLDSHPQRGSITDARMLIGVLAYYYLLADPEFTFLTFFGGDEPASSWTRHWAPAAAYNIGKPKGRWSQRATGADPANAALSYRLYQREYDRALVLYKPLSHVRGRTILAANGDETATAHELGANYRPLRADGTLGDPIRSISLRNGEGAILIAGQP